MRSRKKTRPGRNRPAGARPGGWLAALRTRSYRSIFQAAGLVLFLALVGVVLRLVDTRVEAQLLDRISARLEYPDIPAPICDLVVEDLNRRLAPLLSQPWTSDGLCASLGEKARSCPWVTNLRHVRRRADGVFVVSAVYHEPFVMVDMGDGYALVDRDGVRLPGAYAFHRTWKLIQGAGEPPPPPGAHWGGADLAAGIVLLDRLMREPFADQLTGVLVHNFGGRVDPQASHLEISTDRAGGRIRWGSAPGSELEENTVEQKLALLRANFHSTGRVDTDKPVIDVTTYPDRIVVPATP